MNIVGIMIGLGDWFVVRCLISGIYTVNQSERAVKTSFGRAERIPGASTTTDPISASLDADEKQRYAYPQVRVIVPGGPYFKLPWQKIYKVSVATQTVNMAYDPESNSANQSGTVVEAVTKDQLNTGLTGQIRYRISERNLYAYLFGVKNPIAHVMGYFVSVLRERIATFEAPPDPTAAVTSPDNANANVNALPASAGSSITAASGISINDLRKNLRDLNEHMDSECASSEARYGIKLDASLITGIDPPAEVESALAAINTAHNMVSSDISLAQAAADQRIELSKRAAEIETLKAQAEVQPLTALASQLSDLKRSGPGALRAYVRNVRLGLIGQAQQAVVESKR
jgi:regulator of protease activity HflC (stomatin/prohibitin superfamily)